MAYSIVNYWQYIDSSCPQLVDPRLAVCRQMAWSPPSGLTNYFGCEPDNYNSAVFDTKPHDLAWVKDQCFYYIDTSFKRKTIHGWISLYVVDENDKHQFNREMLKIQPQAVWRYTKAKTIRPKRTLMQRSSGYNTRGTNVNLSTEERLYQLGYYNELKNKYFDDEHLFKVVGTPREGVLNSIPEELNEVDGF